MEEDNIFKAIKESNNKLLEKILATNPNIDEILNYYRENPLHFAILQKNFDAVKLFLTYGVDLEKKVHSFGGYYKDYTPIQIAARDGSSEIAKLLIDKGADIFKKDQRGASLIHIACIGGSKWLVEYLFKKGMDINRSDNIDWLPIHYAAINLNTEIIKFLIEHGSLINPQTQFGETPLHLAAGTLQSEEKPEEHFRTIELLIQNGANLYIKNESGLIPAESVFDISTQDFIGSFAAKQKGDPIAEWLSNAIDFFRNMGFFEKYKQLSKEELIKKIKELMKDSPWMFSPNSAEPDLPLLFLDKDRVYNCPMIGDANLDFAVTQKDKRYKEFLENLNPIGRGIVKFEDIQEEWKGKEGPIEISFKYNGKFCIISQDYFGDFFDEFYIQQINNVIDDSGYFFDLYNPYDIVEWGGFVTLLNNEERNKLIKERGWNFYSEAGFKKVRASLEELYLERLCEKWMNDAFQFEKKGEYNKAAELYIKALSHDTDLALDAEIWFNAGNMLALEGKHEESKTYLNKAIEMYEESLKRILQGSKKSSKSLKKSSRGATELYYLARTYALLKNRDKTLEALKRAIELDPKYIKDASEQREFNFLKNDKDFRLITK